MTKSEQNALAVVDYLLASGWAEDGQTDAQTVRVATTKSPVYGRGAYGGGELRTFGGRQRLIKVGTEWKVTVGTRSVNFYRVGDIEHRTKSYLGRDIVRTERGPVDFKGFDTRDLDLITAHAQGLK